MKINNIHCLALNYKGVGIIDESPIYFLKSTSCLSYEKEIIPFPKFQIDENNIWTEVELGIRIIKDCENIEDNIVEEYIEGFFIAGDITCSNIHGRDHHLSFSKARTRFCPISKNIKKLNLRDQILDMRTYINGKLTQQGDTSMMILDAYKSVSYLSKIVKLQEGDIILTGTPLGAHNNIVKPGDKIKHTIDKLGELNYSFSL